MLAKEAFPLEEYLPPAKLVQMAEAEDFDFIALEDAGKFVGFLAVQLYENLAYLFFLAIMPSCRGKGYGGRVPETLQAMYSRRKQVVDFEMPYFSILFRRRV